MGHIRLGDRLPRTRKWIDVVELIGADGATANIAAATFEASQGGSPERRRTKG